MKLTSVAGLGALYLVAIVASAGAQSSPGFDFFYLVLQWPGSYCDLSTTCCYPTSGKPAANFSIHGLWPNDNNGQYPSNCDSSNPFDLSQVEDLVPALDRGWGSLNCPSSDSTQFWTHEWDKHGTCSGLQQHAYFSAALSLLDKIDFLTPLTAAGIVPNGGTYNSGEIQNTAAKAIQGYTPGVECNNDDNGQSQLYQIYVCVDTDAATLIDCPVFPSGQCQSSVAWPSF